MKVFILGLLAVFWGHLAMGQTLYTFNGGGTSGSWSDPTIWTTDPTGSTSVGARVPASNDNVVVTNSFVVQVSSSVAATGLSITVQKGGVIDLNTATAGFANTLTRLAGQGTLRIGRPYFPTVTTNDFDDANTGTVEFYNWPAGPTVLPKPTSSQYCNLRLLNTTTTAYVAQLDNDLTLTGGLTLTRTNTAAVTLNLGSTASSNRTLTIQGNVTVGAGTSLGITAVAGSHTMSVGGSFVNSGTINLHNGTTNDNQVALLKFTGATDANFACNGPTNLDILQVDKGVDSQVLLNVTATVAAGGASSSNLTLSHVAIDTDLLALVNGVVKLGLNINLAKIHNGSTAGIGFNIGSSSTNPTLWIDGATLYNNNATGVVVYGTYRISNGRFESITPDAMVIREDGQVLIEGGTTLVDKYRPSSTASTHRGSFTMTGGTFEANGSYSGTSTATDFARFAIPYLTQSFRMSGGTLRVANPVNCTGLFHIGINSDNATVSGGTIELVVPNSTTINGKILSTAPLWNLTIKKASSSGTSKAILDAVAVPTTFTSGATTTAQPLTVLNNLTIDGTYPTTFDATPSATGATAQDVTIQGTLTIAAGSTYLTGNNTTTFSGGQDQLLTNNGTIGTTANVGTFNKWTINKSAGTLTLAGANNSFTVTGALSLLGGVLNDGGKTVNAKGSVVNSASHTSGGGSGSIVLAGTGGQVVSGDGTGVFGNLTINSTAAAGAIAATLTANMSVASTLTMMSTNILAIGANRLSLTNVVSTGDGSALVLGPGNNFSTSCFIQTAGNQSDLGLQKTYGKGDSFTFPVGTGTGTSARYAPVTVELRLASSAPLDKFGQVSVSPASKRHPFVANTTNSLAYYWKVRSTGFGPIPSGSVYESFTMTNADAAGTLANYVPGRYQPTAWTKYATSGMAIGSSVSFIRFSGINAFDGEFTAGEPGTFGAITAFYSRANGPWTTNTTWSTSSNTGAAVPTGTTAGTNFPGPSNPVFIGSASTALYHTVTVPTGTAALSGSLVIDRGSTLDVGTTTGHNFGSLPDSKVGGSGRLRVSATGTTTPLVATFPGGDFGSFIQYGGGTVEYYTSGKSFMLPTTSGTLTLNQYRNLWLNATSTTQTITLPAQDLRVYAQLKTGVTNTTPTGTTTTFPGTVLVNTGAAGNLRADSLLAVQAGIFRLQGTTARTLTFDTDVQVASGATFNVLSNAAVTHTLSVGGSLVNNGTLDFKVGTGQAGLIFLGSQDAYLTSAGTVTDLYTLTVNKGLGRTALLNLDGTGSLTTPTNGWLTLTNGTLRYAKPNGTLTIHDLASPYLITDNAGLTVDASGATVTVATNTTAYTNATTAYSANSDLKLAGQLKVLQGKLSVGATGGLGNDLEYASAGAPAIQVTGGNLYVNGQIRRTVANLDGSLRFDQSGGTIDIDGQGATAAQSNERGLFEVQGSKSIFRMSGGTLNLHRSNQKNPILTADLYLAPDSTVVTGGTVVLGNAASGVGNVTISINSTVPLYDLRVETGADNTNTNTGLLAGVIPLTLKGSLTIGNDNSFFNANGLGLNIGQHLVNNNTSASTALNAGGFQPIAPTQTTTFTGGLPTQLLTGTATNLTVFGSLTVANAQTSGTVQLGGNAQVAGTLTLTKGTLDDNDQTITVLGDVLNSATHTSGGTGAGSMILAGAANQNIGGNNTGRFGNLTLNNSTGATTTANQQVTQVLTLTNGILNIGSNLLWLSNTAAGAVAGTFSATRAIQTNGIVADLGLRKSYPAGASDFTFPLGVAGKYTPVRMNVTSNTAAGMLTAKPVNLAHPSTTDPLAKELNYYWKVSSTGFASPKVTQVFSYLSTDVQGTESSYKLGRFLNGAWTPQNGITASTVSTTNHTLTNSNVAYFDGDYTGGETSEFGAVPTYYSRNSTAGLTAGANWNDATAWTFNANGTDSSPLPTTFPTLANPVVVRAGHLINSNGASRGAATLQLLGTLDLSTYGANNFNTVTGTGTVRIGSALFPAGNYSDFMTATGGTVDYSGAVQLPARDTYNNLTFSGGNAKQLSNVDLTINGALTVAANTTVSNPTNQNITLVSSTSGATVNGTLNLGDGVLTTGAFLTNAGTLTLGMGLTSVGTNFTNSGTLNNGSGAVNIAAAFANSGTYKANVGTGDLIVGTTFTNSGSYVAGTGKLTVNGNFSNATGGQFTAASGDVVVTTGNFANAGTYTAASNRLRLAGSFTNLTGGSFLASGSIMALQGDFTNNGTFDPGTGLVQFITDATRTLTGSTTFYDVQKVGMDNLSLGANTTMTVADVLTMRNGLIYTGTSNAVSLINYSMQPIVGASTTSYIAGRLAMTLPIDAANIRVFPVGLGGRYRPVTITSQAATSTSADNPVVLAEIINQAPTGPLDATLSNMSANRYYRVQLQSGTITQPTVQLSFNTDVVDEEVHVPGNLRVAKASSPTGPWSTAGGAGVFSPEFPRGYTASSSSLTAINNTSFFALASTNQVDNPLTGPAPLPVTLLRFTAARQGTAVRAAWVTASEQNSAYFVVQRSADSRTFEDLQRVAAQGTSATQHDYVALDPTPLAGVSYYRLRQVDTDGKYVYSPVVTVRFDGQADAAMPVLSAYPNPAALGQSFQLLATNLSTTGGTVQVFDNLGRVVLTQVVATGTVETTIQPSRPLASGMYFVTWLTPDGQKLTTKVAVQ